MAKKIFIGFVALVLVAFVLLFQFGGRAAEELTKKLLAEQTASARSFLAACGS